MTNDGKVQIYRSSHEKVRSLNDAGLDLAELCDQVVGLPEEGTKYVFPVRAQLTHYRLIHPLGTILTEIISQDEFFVQVKATVSDGEGKVLSTGHGMSTANADAARGFQMLPTAESRAIGRALSFAGFGCQLRIQSYDGDDFTPSPVNVPDAETDVPTPNVQLDPAVVPDSINTRLKVPANDDRKVLDVRELEEQTSQVKSRQRRAKKEEAPPADEHECAEPLAEPPENKQEPEETPPVPDGVADKPDEPTPPTEAASLPSNAFTPEEQIDAFLKSACDEPLLTRFDPDYFGENYSGDIDPNATFVNANGQQTQVTNGMLQRMISFYLNTPGELQKQTKAPVVSTSANFNKTLGELIEEGDRGKSVVRLCSEAYRKDSPATLASVLVCAKLYCAP